MNHHSPSQCATTVEDAQSAVEDLVWQLQVGVVIVTIITTVCIQSMPLLATVLFL